MPKHTTAAAAIALLFPAAALAQPPDPDPLARPPNASPAIAAPADPLKGVARLERQQLVELVLDRNPSLAAARAAWEAARQRPAQVTALPDPVVSWEVAPLTLDGGGRLGQRLSAGQMLPYPGKLSLRGAMAQAEAAMAAQDLETVRLELALEAALHHADWYLVHRALEINAEHTRLLQGVMESVTVRYASGQSSQQDPLQAEVELAHLEHQQMTLQREREVLAARINALLHRPAEAALPPPAALDRPGPGRHARQPSRLDLAAAALAARPELAALDAEIQARAAELDLARLERKPDLGVMGSYESMPMDADERWMVGVSVSLPLRRQRLAAMEAEAEARLAAAHSRRQALEDRVRAEVRQAALRVAEAGHIIELYRSRLAPASRDRVQAARVAFESSRVDFPALIDAERNLRTVELGLEQALTSYRQRLAELARLTGQPPGVVEERDLLDGVAALGGDLPFAPSAETPAAPPSLPGAAAAGDTP